MNYLPVIENFEIPAFHRADVTRRKSDRTKWLLKAVHVLTQLSLLVYCVLHTQLATLYALIHLLTRHIYHSLWDIH